MNRIIVPIVLIVLLSLLSDETYAQFNVKDFGARGDGVTLDSRSIQSAIDKAFEMGGGVVNVTSGTYLIGTLILKDNVDLNIQAGAVLLGSPDYKDYTEIFQKFESRTNELYAKYFLIFAEGAKNISITGAGTVNGNGFNNYQKTYPANLRPVMVRLVNCENVIVRDIHLLEAANWTLHLLGCRDVNIDGIVIENGARANRDGLDIDCCQRVTVSNSRFSTGDDAIVLKSTSDTLCQDIAITNCILRTTASAVKTGTESNGGFKNITVSNCVIKDVPYHAGIELMTVDGGIMQNILLQNITMENVATPIFIRVAIRARPYKTGQYVSKIENVRDIYLNNITVVNAKLPSSIIGMHNRKIKNIVINNYTVRNSGIEDPLPYNMVPFEELSYPMSIMFTHLPAFGLYCRNAEELHLQNVIMYSAENEVRPALVFDRVNNLELFSVKAESKNKTVPMVHFRNSENIIASFCRSIGKCDVIFEVEDSTVDELKLSNNILQTGQEEIALVRPLHDEYFFEDFKTDLKFSVEKGENFKGLTARNLNDNPLKFNFEIAKRESLKLCLLILNDSIKPAKTLIKYEGITQEFAIDWNEWGWAPVTLLKEFPTDRKVDFEIQAEDQSAHLKIAKVYLLYQEINKTD